MEIPPPVLEARVCDQCGCFDSVQVGDRWLCVDCYSVAGACCALKSGNPEASSKDAPATGY
jgi:hypothetical protein